MNIANAVYILTCICFSLILGAGLYEHIAVWPAGFAAPPKSLGLFQGMYKLNAAPFWRTVHPVTLLLLLTTLFLFWPSKKRGYVLWPAAVYGLVLAATFLYFVPELVRLTGTPYSDSVDTGLQSRGALWIKLSLVRLAAVFMILFFLCWGLTVAEPESK